MSPGFDLATRSFLLSRPVDELYALGVTSPQVIGGWQVAGLGTLYSSYTTLDTTEPNLHPWVNQYIGGPMQWLLDASWFKRIRIREGVELQFTIDAFNVFNHPNNPAGGGVGILGTRGQSNASRELPLSVPLSW